MAFEMLGIRADGRDTVNGVLSLDSSRAAATLGTWVHRGSNVGPFDAILHGGPDGNQVLNGFFDNVTRELMGLDVNSEET